MVVFHAFQWLDDQFWIGAAGVDVFFVISGFIIWTVGARPGVTPAGFLWRRFTRVAPAYWLMTAVVAAIALADPGFLPQVAVTPAHLLLSLAFVQHADPHGLMFPLLPPGWTLNYEALFYGMFAAILFAPAAARFALVVAALAVVSLFGFLDPPAYGVIANPMFMQFAAGAWLGRRYLLKRRWEPGAGVVMALAALAALAMLYLFHLRSELWRPLLWGAPAVALVGGAVSLEASRTVRWPRMLTGLGDASYAVYLCHLPATAVVAHTLGVKAPALFVPLAVAASLAAGVAFHRLAERPLIAVVRAAARRARG